MSTNKQTRMPRPTLPSILKNCDTYEVLLTKTTEEDLLKHFKSASEEYEAKWRSYYDRLDTITAQQYHSNPYTNHNWRKGSPERKFAKGYEWYRCDDESYEWLYAIRNDLRRCEREFKWSQQEELKEWYGNFDYLIDKCLGLLRSTQEELSRIDERNFEKAKNKWKIDDAEWIASEEKRKAHAFHEPREYYIELFKKDKDAERWYNGKIPDNEETCELCIKEKKEKEEREQREKEEEEKERQQEEERRQQRQVQEQEKKPQCSKPTINYHCEDCDYHTTSKFNYESHLNSKQHAHILKRKSWYCETCEIQCVSQIAFNQHITTAKHRKAVGELKSNVFRCEACDYTAKLKHHYDNHCQSKRHLERVQAD